MFKVVVFVIVVVLMSVCSYYLGCIHTWRKASNHLIKYAAQQLRAVDGGEVLPPHNHIYVDGYCACGHAVERHRH